MEKWTSHVNKFEHVVRLEIKQHIYNTADEFKKISSLFPKGAEDIFRPEEIDKEKEEIKKETDYLTNEQKQKLDLTERQYLDSLDHNEWKKINKNLVDQNGENPPLRIKELFKKAVSLRNQTKLYIKASDVGLHSVDNYGAIGSFWVGDPIPPTDVQQGDTIIEFTLPARTTALLLSNGTYIIDQSAFEINTRGVYFVNGKRENFARGKLVDMEKMDEKLISNQKRQELELSYGYRDMNPAYVLEVPKKIFSLEEVKGPYASYFLGEFFAIDYIKNTIETITEGIPTEVLFPLMNVMDANDKGLIRFTTKDIPYGIKPSERIVPYAKYVEDGKYIEVTLPDPKSLNKTVSDYMKHDVKKALVEAMDDQFFKYNTPTDRPTPLADSAMLQDRFTEEGSQFTIYKSARTPSTKKEFFYEVCASLFSHDLEEQKRVLKICELTCEQIKGQIIVTETNIKDANSKDPTIVHQFLEEWAHTYIPEAPYIPNNVKWLFLNSILPDLLRNLQTEFMNTSINSSTFNPEKLGAYNFRIYNRFKNSELIIPYLTKPIVSPLEELQKAVEETLHERKEISIPYALNPRTKMFDLSQITDTSLLHDNNFVDALALIMNKIPSEILDTLLNQMDPQQDGLIRPIPESSNNANGVVTDPSILQIQLIAPDRLTPENFTKMTHEGKKQIGYTLDATLFRNASKSKGIIPNTFSTSTELSNIIHKEKNSFRPLYTNSSAGTNQEFFAEVFASFLSEDTKERERVEKQAPDTIKKIQEMMESYSTNIQHIRDVDQTKNIVKTLPHIETYTKNIVAGTNLYSTLEKIRSKVLEGEVFNPVEAQVSRVIELIRHDAASIIPIPIIVYAPNSMAELQTDIANSLTNSEAVNPDLNIFANQNPGQIISDIQPIFNSSAFIYSLQPTAPSDTAVYCTEPTTTITSTSGHLYVIPISNFSEFQTPAQFINENFTTVINQQQSNIQLEKATLQINKDSIREFHLTGKLIEVDKKIVFSEDKVSKIKSILKSILKIEAFARIISRILQNLNPIYGDIYVIVPKSQEKLIPSNADYKSDWDPENNRIALELPSGKEKKDTPKQVSGLLYAFSKKAYTIAKESGGIAGIAVSQFDTIVTNNLSFESLRETILKGSGVDIAKDLRFIGHGLSIATQNHNYFGALGSLYYTNPVFLNSVYPDLFIQISNVFNNLPGSDVNFEKNRANSIKWRSGLSKRY